MLSRVRSESVPHSSTPQVRDIRAEVERVGTALAEVLGVLVGELSDRALGPMDLAAILKTSNATAGKLLRAISRPDAVAVVRGLPGPNPLRSLVERAAERGAKAATVKLALKGIEAYSALVRGAGDIKSFESMLTAWLPEDRRVFETARRQSIFRALSDLDGASCRLQVNTIVLSPGLEEQEIDLVGVTGLFGVYRMRPDVPVTLATQRVPHDPNTNAPPGRHPTSLDGTPLVAGLQDSRLDQFCLARPAPLVAQQFEDYVQYALGPTDIGPDAEFDLLMAELNRSSGKVRDLTPDWKAPFFSTLPRFPARLLVFDLLLHRSIYESCDVELLSYVIGNRGVASPHDAAREFDRRETLEEITRVDYGLRDLRLAEYPKYSALLRHLLDKLGQQSDDFRAFRVRVQFPLPTQQLTMVLRDPAARK